MIKALLANIEGSTDPDEAGDGKSKEELFGVLEQWGVLIAAKCNAGEAKDLRTWVLRVARATAEARSKGGLFGIWSVCVSNDGQSAFSRIDAAISVRS